MLNVNVNVQSTCQTWRQNITIFTVIHSFQSHYKGYLAGKSEDVDQQWTSSSSAAYSITIAIKHRSYHNSQTEISRKKLHFGNLWSLYCTRWYLYFCNVVEVPAWAPVWRYLHISNRKSVPLHTSKTESLPKAQIVI